MTPSISHSIAHSQLAHYLPIVGTVTVIHHAGGFCLASLWTTSSGLHLLETRLSGDFPSLNSTLAFWAALEERISKGEVIWPILEQSCRLAPPLANSHLDQADV